MSSTIRTVTPILASSSTTPIILTNTTLTPSIGMTTVTTISSSTRSIITHTNTGATSNTSSSSTSTTTITSDTKNSNPSSIDKHVVRQQITSILRQLPLTTIATESKLVHDKLLALPQYKSSRSLCLYLSMATGECDTWALMKRVLDDGKQVYVPRVEGKEIMNMYRVVDWKDIGR
jgi:mRNA-degrading endonuclease toxin of MazEF toxin-antitoxin module